ncbi:MAG: AAA family ATPase [Planctomycetales bacterium]|nr:AAA family ATPase [Planctomycetales bacterium]
MHLEYWGLSRAPFASKLTIKDFFNSATHAECLARLEYLVQQSRRLSVLLGPSGTGKSLTLEVLARRLRRSGAYVAKLNLIGLDGPEFLWGLAAALGCHVYEDANTISVWRDVQDRLATLRYQRIPTVVLLDDADECETAALTTVCRLTQMEQQPESKFTIVVACNSNGKQMLGQRLLDLSELPVEIEPLSQAETFDYVNVAIMRAGRNKTPFTDDALYTIHQYTRGIPRAINQLVELCLIGGASEQVETIDDNLVEAVRDAFYGEGIGAVA